MIPTIAPDEDCCAGGSRRFFGFLVSFEGGMNMIVALARVLQRVDGGDSGFLQAGYFPNFFL